MGKWWWASFPQMRFHHLPFWKSKLQIVFSLILSISRDKCWTIEPIAETSAGVEVRKYTLPVWDVPAEITNWDPPRYNDQELNEKLDKASKKDEKRREKEKRECKKEQKVSNSTPVPLQCL